MILIQPEFKLIQPNRSFAESDILFNVLVVLLASYCDEDESRSSAEAECTRNCEEHCLVHTCLDNLCRNVLNLDRYNAVLGSGELALLVELRLNLYLVDACVEVVALNSLNLFYIVCAAVVTEELYKSVLVSYSVSKSVLVLLGVSL